MTDSIENKILNKAKKCGRGSVFFVSDFVSYGSRDAANKALERLVEIGLMLRAARGIYCYPKIEKVYGLGPIPPTMEDIAEAIAKRDGARIIPSGLYAQYQLGLTQQEMAKKSNVLRDKIAKIEAGIYPPNIKSLFKILGPLGYTIKIEKIDNKEE